MHALLHLIASRPQLLADHAQAYGDLLTTEFANWSTAWRRRPLLLAVLASLAQFQKSPSMFASVQTRWRRQEILRPALSHLFRPRVVGPVTT